MPNRTLVILFKIVMFYSVFYVVMKGIMIVQGAWLWVNLLFCVPFLILGALGMYLNKKQQFSWIFTLIGVFIIAVVRCFEKDWSEALHSFFS